jgi:thiol peroxidase
MSSDTTGTLTFQGKVMQLIGKRLILNETAPNFLLVNNAMEEVDLSSFKNKIKVITSFPSLDTPICELQVKRFNKSASVTSDNVVIIAVSKDLPFAQKRFCVDYDINNLTVLSDYKYSSFGMNYGLLVKELNLLARAVIILDANNVVRYIQIGEELTNHLDYEDALNNLNNLMQN